MAPSHPLGLSICKLLHRDTCGTVTVTGLLTLSNFGSCRPYHYLNFSGPTTPIVFVDRKTPDMTVSNLSSSRYAFLDALSQCQPHRARKP
jgi:hypothetical protein